MNVPRSKSVPIGVWVGLGLAIAIDTAVQLSWKSAVLAVPQSATLLETAAVTLRQPLFYAVIVMFLLQFLNWMRVLSRVDLSFAQPITAASYVSVAVLSAVLFHENVYLFRCVGIAFILLGVWFISQTDHNTTEDAAGSLRGEPATAVVPEQLGVRSTAQSEARKDI